MSTLCQPSGYDESGPRIAPIRGAFDRVFVTTFATPPLAFDELAECPAELVKRHRTGDVARLAPHASRLGVDAYRKRLWYPTASDRLRGALRTTWLARSRVAGEAESLERLASWGVQPRLLLAWGERRRRGVLHDSFLVTRALEARPLDVVLREEREPGTRARWLAELGRFVASLHARGFVDRDLHLRNLLASDGGALAKIDSPFGAVVPRWRRGPGQRRELELLRRELAALVTPAELPPFEDALRAASSCRG